MSKDSHPLHRPARKIQRGSGLCYSNSVRHLEQFGGCPKSFLVDYSRLVEYQQTKEMTKCGCGLMFFPVAPKCPNCLAKEVIECSGS